MDAYRELVLALDRAEEAIAGLGDPADRVGAQQRALARLQDLLDGGLPPLAPGQGEALALRLKDLLRANGLNLKWTRLRAQLARIGAPRVAPSAPGAPRLDIVF